jgi:transcriptional regulator with XRE-family HTH domain
MGDISLIFSAPELGRQLRHERRALGLTQQQLAMRVGVSRQTLIDLEKGKNVSLQVLMSILAGLGKALKLVDARPSVEDCQGRPNSEPPRRTKFEPGLDAVTLTSVCG